MLCILGVIFLFQGGAVRADELLSPKQVSDLGDVAVDRAFRARNAWVSFIDEEGLALDHPEVAEAIREGRVRSWKDWVIENFAVISEQQTKLSGFNTPINYDEKVSVQLYRKNRAGRTATAEARLDGKVIGLMNLKGIGNSKDTSDGLDGLLKHSVAISETERQRAVQRNADDYNALHPRSNYQTVPIRFIIVYDFHATSEGTTERAATIGRKAYKEGKNESFGHLPKKLGVKSPSLHQASASGALNDFGNTAVDKPGLDEFEPIPTKSRLENDRVHKAARIAAEAFEKGKLDVVQNHLDQPDLKPIGPQSLSKEIPYSSDDSVEMHALKTYLATQDPNLKQRLEFTLAAFYQRDEHAFERAVEFMKEEAAKTREHALALTELRRALQRWMQGIGSEEIYNKATERYFKGWVPPNPVEMGKPFEDQIESHFTGRPTDSPLARSYSLIRRSILDHELYPFGARYKSITEIEDLAKKARVPENAILFMSDPGPAHRRHPILEAVLAANAPLDDAETARIWRHLSSTLQFSNQTEKTHGMDFLLESLQDLDSTSIGKSEHEDFNVREKLRRLALLFNQIGDPPIERDSVWRVSALAALRSQAEQIFLRANAIPRTERSNHADEIAKSAALLAARLGTQVPEIQKALRVISEEPGAGREAVSKAHAAASRYQSQVRRMMASQYALAIANDLYLSKRTTPMSLSERRMARSEINARLAFIDAAFVAFPKAITRAELNKVARSVRVDAITTFLSGDGGALDLVHFPMGQVPNSGIQARGHTAIDILQFAFRVDGKKEEFSIERPAYTHDIQRSPLHFADICESGYSLFKWILKRGKK